MRNWVQIAPNWKGVGELLASFKRLSFVGIDMQRMEHGRYVHTCDGNPNMIIAVTRPESLRSNLKIESS